MVKENGLYSLNMKKIAFDVLYFSLAVLTLVIIIIAKFQNLQITFAIVVLLLGQMGNLLAKYTKNKKQFLVVLQEISFLIVIVYYGYLLISN